MKEYTTAEVADKVGDITADSIRKYAKKWLTENVEYKKYGPTIMITEAGVKRIMARDTKPGPKPNGSKSK